MRVAAAVSIGRWFITICSDVLGQVRLSALDSRARRDGQIDTSESRSLNALRLPPLADHVVTEAAGIEHVREFRLVISGARFGVQVFSQKHVGRCLRRALTGAEKLAVEALSMRRRVVANPISAIEISRTVEGSGTAWMARGPWS